MFPVLLSILITNLCFRELLIILRWLLGLLIRFVLYKPMFNICGIYILINFRLLRTLLLSRLP